MHLRRLAALLPWILPIALVSSGAPAQTAGMKSPVAKASVAATTTSSAGLKPNVPPPAMTGKIGEGWAALEKSDYAEAKKALEAVTGKDAGKATVGLARLLLETGKYEDAVTSAKKAAGLAGSDLAVKYDARGYEGAALLAMARSTTRARSSSRSATRSRPRARARCWCRS